MIVFANHEPISVTEVKKSFPRTLISGAYSEKKCFKFFGKCLTIGFILFLFVIVVKVLTVAKHLAFEHVEQRRTFK